MRRYPFPTGRSMRATTLMPTSAATRHTSNTRLGWRRVIVNAAVIVVLAIGVLHVVTTLLVARGFLGFGPPRGGSSAPPFHSVTTSGIPYEAAVDQGQNVDWVIAVSSPQGPQFEGLPVSEDPTEPIRFPIADSRPVEPAGITSLLDPIHSGSIDDRFWVNGFLAGFPFKSNLGVFTLAVTHSDGQTTRYRVSFGRRWNAFPTSAYIHIAIAGLAPANVLWGPYCANVAIYALGLTVLRLVPPWLRRWVRRRRGCCLKCGYSLTGNASGICPECGVER